MKGDTNYTWISSGSTAASADTAHLLWGNYGGLSDLNADEVIHLQILASANNFYMLPFTDASATELGQRFVAGNDYYIDIPPMKVSAASQLHFRNAVNGSNGELLWVIYSRNAL